MRDWARIAAKNLESGHIRKHDVEHDERVFAGDSALHALRAAVHGLNGETFEDEVLSDEFA